MSVDNTDINNNNTNNTLIRKEKLFKFIEQKKKQPHKELLYPGCQTDKNKDDQTPLMYWIKYCRGKDIPECLYYDNYQTDRDKFDRTPLMSWI